LNSTCTATAEDKVTWYVTTAEFYLAVQDSGFASQVIKRAHALVNEIKSNPGKLCIYPNGVNVSVGLVHIANVGCDIDGIMEWCLVWVAQIELTVRFRTQYARVLDNDRKFFEASMRYYINIDDIISYPVCWYVGMLVCGLLYGIVIRN
jgi:hypothetical protein